MEFVLTMVAEGVKVTARLGARFVATDEYALKARDIIVCGS